jgi:large subunit ribosomal protein L10
MAKIELKRPVVEEIANVVKDADSVILVNYSGLTVAQDTELRRNLRAAGISYKVYKNTMMRLAFEGTSCEALDQHLENTNALAVSKDDATAPVRVLAEFAKKNPKLELVAGVVEGKYFDQNAVKALADIPSRDILLGRLLGSMQSPIANFARVIKQIAEKDGAPAEAAEAPAAE